MIKNSSEGGRLQGAMGAIIGTSLATLKDLVIAHAKKGTPLLFIGETGTGKELLASLYKEAWLC